MDSIDDLRMVLSAVSRATGIREDQIFSRKRGQIYYDARWIAVQLLIDKGYYDGQIADMVGITRRNVCRIRQDIGKREGNSWKQFGRQLEVCRNALGICALA